MDDIQPDNPDLSLDEFPPATWDEWRQAAVASLKGRPFEKLITPTWEGIPIQPLYRGEDTANIAAAQTNPGEPPQLRGTSAAGYPAQPWAIAQALLLGDPAAFNRALRFDLEHGQTVVNLTLDGPTRAGLDPDGAEVGEVGRGGVSLATAEDMATALRSVDLANIPTTIDVGASALPLLALLVAAVRQSGRDPVEALHGCLEDDPLGELARTGCLPVSLDRAFDEMALTTRWAERNAPHLATIAVHSDPYHEGGANAVQELAFALATGVAYLQALTRREVSIATAARHMRFCFAIGGDFFMEIAKLRAARQLWAQVVAAFGGDEEAQRMQIHGRTARRNQSTLDPHSNMLRVTTEALAAAVGGVGSLHVAPFDEPARPPDEFSRRIARNVQVILQEEAHLTQLIDPAGGSWAVETLTDQLARAAWALFQDTDRRGGMAALLIDGYAQTQIAAVAAKRATNLATRRDVLVGVNMFANPREDAPLRDETDYEALYRERVTQTAACRARGDTPARTAALDQLVTSAATDGDALVEAAIDVAAAGATLCEISRSLRAHDSGRTTIGPIPSQRASEPYEALRRAADAYAVARGQRPRVFLANMGPPKQHKARADFAQGFFAAGGFRISENNGFATPEEAAAAADESGAPAVVICSTDETYPEIVPPLVEAIRKKARDTIIILAGRPAEQVEALREAGVDEFIYLGADCLAMNEWLIAHIAEQKH